MSDIRKLLDTINEMATVSGSVATVATPMGATQRRTKESTESTESTESVFNEDDAVCPTCHQHQCQCDANSRKAPDAPPVSNFGLWKNSILAGKEQKAKKKLKVKESVTDYNPTSQGGTRKELLAKLRSAKSAAERSALATRARKAGATQQELRAVSEETHDNGDQTLQVIKKAGKPIGEIGINPGLYPGRTDKGQYYAVLYDTGYDDAGFKTAEEAMAALKMAIKRSESPQAKRKFATYPKFALYPSYHEWRQELSRRGDDQIDHLDNDLVDNYRVLFAVDKNRNVVGMYYYTADIGTFVPAGKGFSDMIYYANTDPNWPYTGDDGEEDLSETAHRLDELDTSTLQSYLDKGRQDVAKRDAEIEKIRFDRDNMFKSKPAKQKRTDAMNALRDKQNLRKDGIAMAHHKLSNRGVKGVWTDPNLPYDDSDRDLRETSEKEYNVSAWRTDQTGTPDVEEFSIGGKTQAKSLAQELKADGFAVIKIHAAGSHYKDGRLIKSVAEAEETSNKVYFKVINTLGTGMPRGYHRVKTMRPLEDGGFYIELSTPGYGMDYTKHNYKNFSLKLGSGSGRPITGQQAYNIINGKQDVAEGDEQRTFAALKDWQQWNVLILNNFYNGKYPDYSARMYGVVASSPEEARQVVLDNADYVLKDLLSRKTPNGKRWLPPKSAVPIEDKRVGGLDQIKPGSLTTMGFKPTLTPDGLKNIKFSDGQIVDIQGEESDVTEGGKNPSPGWMLRQDPVLAKKVKDAKAGYKDLKKYAGKDIPKKDVSEAYDDSMTDAEWEREYQREKSEKEQARKEIAKNHVSQFKTKEEAVQYANDKLKTFKDSSIGMSVYSMPDGGFDVISTARTAAAQKRSKLISDAGGKHLGTLGLRYTKHKMAEDIGIHRNKTIQENESLVSTLQSAWSRIERVDPDSPHYKKLVELLNGLPQSTLQELVDAKIKFVSSLARNRLKKSIGEAKQTDELASDLTQHNLKRMASRHRDEEWTLEQLKKLGEKLAAASKKTKSVKEIDAGEGQRALKLAEQDFILNPHDVRRSSLDIVPKVDPRQDHEVEMACSDLYQAAKNARTVLQLIKDTPESVGLEGWVQEKIIKASDYLNTVREYLEGQGVRSAMSGNFNMGNMLDESVDNPLEAALVRRFMSQHTDVLQQYGPMNVLAAIEDVASEINVGDELGTSDVSAYVQQVLSYLSNNFGNDSESFGESRK